MWNVIEICAAAVRRVRVSRRFLKLHVALVRRPERLGLELQRRHARCEPTSRPNRKPGAILVLRRAHRRYMVPHPAMLEDGMIVSVNLT
jgi:hypothetical protein